MNPKIRFLGTMYGKKYVCSDGVFSGLGDSFPEAYNDWERQGRGAFEFSNDVALNGLPESYSYLARRAPKLYNRSDILKTVDMVIWELQNVPETDKL